MQEKCQNILKRGKKDKEKASKMLFYVHICVQFVRL